MCVELYLWSIELEGIFVLPLAPCWVQHSYLSKKATNDLLYLRVITLPFLSRVVPLFLGLLSKALPRLLHHHRHHAVVLPENSSYYFTIACWIEEVKAPPSRTSVERGDAIHSALGSGVRGTDRDWIAKTFDYINHVS